MPSQCCVTSTSSSRTFPLAVPAPRSPCSVGGSACCGRVTEKGSHTLWPMWRLTEHVWPESVYVWHVAGHPCSSWLHGALHVDRHECVRSSADGHLGPVCLLAPVTRTAADPCVGLGFPGCEPGGPALNRLRGQQLCCSPASRLAHASLCLLASPVLGSDPLSWPLCLLRVWEP